MDEITLMNACRLAMQKEGVTNFRINVGKVKLADGRWFSTGPPPGFSDIFGYDQQGNTVFVETKLHPKKPTPEQVKFLLAAIKGGCKAGVAYTVDDAMKIVKWDDDFKNSMVDYLKELQERK